MAANETLEKMKLFNDTLKTFTLKFEQTVDDFFPHDEGHDLWQVWQPLSTASGRLERWIQKESNGN